MPSLFDTLAYTRRLKTAGVDGAQAEAFADALQVAFHECVATKSDIGGVRADTAILKAYSARREAKLNVLQWAVGLHALLSLAMAARLFGAF